MVSKVSLMLFSLFLSLGFHWYIYGANMTLNDVIQKRVSVWHLLSEFIAYITLKHIFLRMISILLFCFGRVLKMSAAYFY